MGEAVADEGAPSLPSKGNLITRWNRSPAIWLVLFAILVRGAVAMVSLDHFNADSDAYRAIAETLARSGVFGLTTPDGEVVATAFRPPLYPFVLALIGSLGVAGNLGIAVLHAILGGVTAACTYGASIGWLGKRRGRLPGILAGIVVIVDPILVQQSTLVMTETLATAIASLVLWWWMGRLSQCLTIRSAFILGLLLASAYLCRPTFLVWGVLLVFALCLSNSPVGKSRRERLIHAALAASILASSVGLWTLRNAAAIGHPVWATTHGGYTLLLGNNPLFYRHLREDGLFSRWDATPFLTAYAHRYEADPTTEAYWFRDWNIPVVYQPELSATLTEHDDDVLTYQAAKATIHRDRGMFLASCLVRVYRLWTPFPYGTETRSTWKIIGIGTYYSVLYIAVLVGLVRLGSLLRLSTWWPIPTLVLTLTLVHAVYWSNMRMRAPAIPAIAILAAAAVLRGNGEKED